MRGAREGVLPVPQLSPAGALRLQKWGAWLPPLIALPPGGGQHRASPASHALCCRQRPHSSPLGLTRDKRGPELIGAGQGWRRPSPPLLGTHVSAKQIINPFAAGMLRGWTPPFQTAAPTPAPPRSRGPSRPVAPGSAAAANFPRKRQLFMLPRAPPSQGRAPAAPGGAALRLPSRLPVTLPPAWAARTGPAAPGAPPTQPPRAPPCGPLGRGAALTSAGRPLHRRGRAGRVGDRKSLRGRRPSPRGRVRIQAPPLRPGPGPAAGRGWERSAPRVSWVGGAAARRAKAAAAARTRSG